MGDIIYIPVFPSVLSHQKDSLAKTAGILCSADEHGRSLACLSRRSMV